MSYSLTTIWYERQRFLPAILAVAFSAVLVAVSLVTKLAAVYLGAVVAGRRAEAKRLT